LRRIAGADKVPSSNNATPTTDYQELNMKTEFTRNNKDNIATSTLVAITLFALASGVFNSRPAAASHTGETITQKMDAIVVTGTRAPDAILDTIVVTASRKIDHA
jgi:hypothetical protein